ncbi:MAG: cobyrinate a,c-diamide synthase [Janthinobacterium lividum]
MTPALIVAAPRSGSGKTTVTLALVAALRARGLRVRVAKSGPDYIDPAFHERASAAPCVNLDTWAMPPALLAALLHAPGPPPDLLVIEASMGLFDGAGATPGRTGAAADLAARFALPVLLVIDVSGQSQSAGATARGFATHDPAVRVAGCVLNRVGSPRHLAGAGAAVAAAGVPLLGSLPRDPAIALPERHLGLVQASEHDSLDPMLARLAALAESRLDLDAILALARPPATAPDPAAPAPGLLPPPGQRIALAWDAAFSFAYPHMLAGWRAAGAEVTRFSPLADEPPPDDCDCCWLPGGYPELHAPALAAAATFRTGLARFARTRPVHGECGGYMVLGQGLTDAAGARHAMAALLSHDSSYARRRMHLGYREATLLHDSPIGRTGQTLRGHEFHYATSSEETDAPLATLRDANGDPLGPAGARRGLVTGTYFHAIALQEP